MTQGQFKIISITLLVITILSAGLFLSLESPIETEQSTTSTGGGGGGGGGGGEGDKSAPQITAKTATPQADIDSFFKQLDQKPEPKKEIASSHTETLMELTVINSKNEPTIETQNKPVAVTKSKTIPSPKAPEKFAFQTQTFWQKNLYGLSLNELNSKISGYNFITPQSSAKVFFQPSQKLYDHSLTEALIFSTSGISYLELKFKPKVNSTMNWAILAKELTTEINKDFGPSTKTDTRADDSVLRHWQTIDGLRVILECSYASDRPYINIKLSDNLAKIALTKPNSQEVVAQKTFTPPKTLTTKVTASTVTLGEFLSEKKQQVFSLSHQDFQKKYSDTFKAIWTDKFKVSARSTKTLDFFKIKSKETIFSFRKNKLTKITMMIYNKGDEDEMTKSGFTGAQQAAISAITAMTGSKPHYKPNAGIAKNHLHWLATKDFLIKLEANYTETKKFFSSEYIRLTFSPTVKGLNAVNIDKASINILSDQELKGMVSKNKDGDVFIGGIPMVDQGSKGYCACAATARILNYYGREIDQHDIAKLALSSAMGTNLEDLQKALELISAKLRLNMKTIIRCYLGNEKDYSRLIIKLQRAYKKSDIPWTRTLESDDLNKIFPHMAEQDARYKKFTKGIIDSINHGRPLAWALQLGIVPEPDVPQAAGGHMRLIIGYNEITEKIYYSDTWGAGHEKKVMDMTTAFWISSALWEIRPR